MSIKINVTPGGGAKIKQVASLDFQKLYSSIISWFKSREYKFQEIENTHKETPSGGELLLKLNGDRKIDDYVDYYINIQIRIYDLVKVKLDNKTTEHGDVEIIIDAGAIIDKKDIWKKNKLSEFLGFIYNKYIIKDKINDKYLGSIYLELMELSNVIKSQLH